MLACVASYYKPFRNLKNLGALRCARAIPLFSGGHEVVPSQVEGCQVAKGAHDTPAAWASRSKSEGLSSQHPPCLGLKVAGSGSLQKQCKRRTMLRVSLPPIEDHGIGCWQRPRPSFMCCFRAGEIRASGVASLTWNFTRCSRNSQRILGFLKPPQKPSNPR